MENKLKKSKSIGDKIRKKFVITLVNDETCLNLVTMEMVRCRSPHNTYIVFN